MTLDTLEQTDNIFENAWTFLEVSPVFGIIDDFLGCY